MKNNYKNRVYNARKKQNEKDYKNNKVQRTKNFLAYVLAFFMIVWSICSVLGTIAFFRDGKQENDVVTAYAESVDGYDDNFPNQSDIDYLGAYANNLRFPYTVLPEDYEPYASYGFYGMNYSCKMGGVCVFNGRINYQAPSNGGALFMLNANINDPSFDIILPNMKGGQYYYLYSGNDMLEARRYVIAYYDNNNNIVYHNMSWGPLLWANTYKFHAIFVRLYEGDYFNNEVFYFSLLTSTNLQDLQSIDNSAGALYYNMPINYGYPFGFEDGYQAGYQQGLENSFKSYLASSSYYLAFNRGGVQYCYPLTFVTTPYGVDLDSSIEYTYNYVVHDLGLSYDYLGLVVDLPNELAYQTFRYLQAFSWYVEFYWVGMSSANVYISEDGILNYDTILDEYLLQGWMGVGEDRYERYAQPWGYKGSNIEIDWSISYDRGVNTLFFNIAYEYLTGVTSTLQPTLRDTQVVYGNAYNSGFDAGKSQGYDEGLKDGALKSNNYNDGYNTGYNIGFSKGAETANNNPYTFKKLLSAIIDTPVQIFAQVFDFNVLGVNLTQFFFSLLSVCFILTVIKLII